MGFLRIPRESPVLSLATDESDDDDDDGAVILSIASSIRLIFNAYFRLLSYGTSSVVVNRRRKEEWLESCFSLLSSSCDFPLGLPYPLSSQQCRSCKHTYTTHVQLTSHS